MIRIIITDMARIAQVEEVRQIFRNFIKKKGLRNTRQREEILDALFSSDRHITVDDLYAVVKKKDPAIGYATVHRNLKLMCECGLADEIKIGNQKARFEQKVGQEHHDHLICMRCGRFIEVNDERIERLQEKLAEANEFLSIRHKLEIYGLCKKCR